MGIAACADWDDIGVCDLLLGVDGPLGYPTLRAEVRFAYFILFPGVSFSCAILCEKPFGLVCVAYVGVVVKV